MGGPSTMNRGQKAAGQMINNRVAQQKGQVPAAQMPAMQQIQSDPQLLPEQMEQEEGV